MPARSPLVTHVLVPLITYSSPSRVGLARDVAGVAAGVGLGQRQARRAARRSPSAGSQRCFCSSVPWCMISVAHIVWVLTMPDRRHPAVGQLLDDADVGEQVEAEAAVLLGDRDAEQPELAHLLDDRRPGTRRRARARDATGMTSRATKRRTVSMISLADVGIGRGGGRSGRPCENSTFRSMIDVDLNLGEECFRDRGRCRTHAPRARRGPRPSARRP